MHSGYVFTTCIIIFLLYTQTATIAESLTAEATFNHNKVDGSLIFRQNCASSILYITGVIYGLKPNTEHGLHVHQFGNLSDNCNGAGPHFNPFNCRHLTPESLTAQANFNHNKVDGVLTFRQNCASSILYITGVIYDLKPNTEHGLHVHQFGNLSDNCNGAGPHFNPFNRRHSGPGHNDRHAGDLGNIFANEADHWIANPFIGSSQATFIPRDTDFTEKQNGAAFIDMTDNVLSLCGPYTAVGRAIVVHAKKDDLGIGRNEDSLKTGNSGVRLACGIITLIDG